MSWSLAQHNRSIKCDDRTEDNQGDTVDMYYPFV